MRTYRDNQRLFTVAVYTFFMEILPAAASLSISLILDVIHFVHSRSLCMTQTSATISLRVVIKLANSETGRLLSLGRNICRHKSFHSSGLEVCGLCRVISRSNFVVYPRFPGIHVCIPCLHFPCSCVTHGFVHRYGGALKIVSS